MRMLMVAALLAPLGACASITRGSTQDFMVESEPPGAMATTTLGLTCAATPCRFTDVRRDSEFSVTVSMPGYVSSTHQITHRTAGEGGAGMAGNLIFGGVIGMAMDANTGATQDLTPNPLRVTLVREEPAQVAADAAAPPAVAEAAAPAAAVPVVPNQAQ